MQDFGLRPSDLPVRMWFDAIVEEKETDWEDYLGVKA